MTIQDNLKRTVHALAGEIGQRSYLHDSALERTAAFIQSELNRYGYSVTLQPYTVQGKTYKNILSGKTGCKTPGKNILIGAHYDTVSGTPGADDNASGIAGLLELARLFKERTPGKSVHFAAFTLEEPPFFHTKHMGSYVYAQSLRDAGKELDGMICLESIGYFTDRPKSQFFPLSFLRLMYPDTGNFIAFVSDVGSKNFLSRVKNEFRKGTGLRAESISTLSVIPGIDFSDHRSFWKFGYNALMVTDTAFYRNPNYHGPGDTPETLDYSRMAEVVTGLESAIERLAG